MCNIRHIVTVLGLALSVLVGCDTNPTPHPQRRPGPADEPNRGTIDPGSGKTETDLDDPAAAGGDVNDGYADVVCPSEAADAVDGGGSGDGGDVPAGDVIEVDGEVSAPSGECAGEAAAPSPPSDSDGVTH